MQLCAHICYAWHQDSMLALCMQRVLASVQATTVATVVSACGRTNSLGQMRAMMAAATDRAQLVCQLHAVSKACCESFYLLQLPSLDVV
jgi:hypothetical protein